MAQTLTNLLAHTIFSTKQRRPLLKAEIRPRLFSYMGGIVRDLSGKALIINGTPDHVHLLVSMPATISIADMMRIVKSKSSRWVREQFSSEGAFAWQAGYGAFKRALTDLTAALSRTTKRTAATRQWTRLFYLGQRFSFSEL